MENSPVCADVIRITQQVGCGDTSDSFFRTAKMIWYNDGFFGFWKGNATQCLKCVECFLEKLRFGKSSLVESDMLRYRSIPHITIAFYIRNVIKALLGPTGKGRLFAALASLLAGSTGSSQHHVRADPS
jgi:hypothetical protein